MGEVYQTTNGRLVEFFIQVDEHGDPVDAGAAPSPATEYAEAAVDDPATGSALLIRSTSNGLRVPSNTYPMPVTQAALSALDRPVLAGAATGGLSVFRSIDLDESEEEVKATAGTVYSICAFNRTAAPLYLKLYNATAANTTVGTTTPLMTFVVPANADSDGAGFILDSAIGFAFSTAISAAVTTGVSDSDTGAPGANDCIVNIGYA